MKKAIALAVLIFCGVSGPAMAQTHAEHSTAHRGSNGVMPHRHGAEQTAAALEENMRISTTLSVSDCWIRSLPRPVPSAAYFVVRNKGTSQEALARLTVAGFDEVSLHQTINQGGMSKMAAVENVRIPKGDELKFQPGSYHAMLTAPNRTVAIGDMVDAEFIFDSGEKAVVPCEVKPPSALSR